MVRDVFRPDRLLGEAALESGPQRPVAVRLQELVQPLDIVNPRVWASMRELGEIREGPCAEVEQMLPLQIPRARLPEAPRPVAPDAPAGSTRRRAEIWARARH